MGLFRRDLKDDINDLQIEVRELSDLVFSTSGKVNDLFLRDSHKTLRPKVDLLSDEFDKFELDVWNHFRMLQEKIEKLGKAEVDLSEKTER